MSYKIITTKCFDRSFKRCMKRGYKAAAFKEAIALLEQNGTLPPKYKPQKLSGKYSGCWECHLDFDWLLVWKQDDERLILILTDTGTHSDIF